MINQFSLKKRILFFVIGFILFIAAGCSSKKESPIKENNTKVTKPKSEKGFVAEKDISTLKSTEILSSLEQPISKDKNAIYTSVFLLAWQEVASFYGGPVIGTGETSEEFTKLINSKSFSSSLLEQDYSKNVEFENGLKVEAFFEKSLPFFQVFRKFDQPFKFKNEEVAAFGMPDYYYEEAINIKICYYKNDQTFALQLLLKDQNHEMILAKGLPFSSDLLSQTNQLENWVKIGKKEQTNINKQWKYAINGEDQMAIPIINFNLTTTFPNIRNQKFQVKEKPHFVNEAFERISFILNEKGGKIEVEEYFTTDSATAEEGEEEEIQTPHPKLLYFNQPFLLLLKKKGAKNPYFVLRIENTELMQSTK